MVEAGEKVRKFRRERVERRVTRHRRDGTANPVLLNAVTHASATFVFHDNIDRSSGFNMPGAAETASSVVRKCA